MSARAPSFPIDQTLTTAQILAQLLSQLLSNQKFTNRSEIALKGKTKHHKSLWRTCLSDTKRNLNPQLVKDQVEVQVQTLVSRKFKFKETKPHNNLLVFHRLVWVLLRIQLRCKTERKK